MISIFITQKTIDYYAPENMYICIHNSVNDKLIILNK
jgi:hypothetical protein